MRFGSVCSGIEAASVAFGPLGWEAAWLAEIEAFPSAVLAHHYPTVPNLGDMTKIAAMVSAEEIEAPDLLCGGTPCQSFSVAGLRKSLDDARGNLSLEFIRIANAIDDIRRNHGRKPAYILWENVPGVLSTKDNAFGAFLGGLCGRDAAIPQPGGGWTSAGVVAGPQRVVAWRVLDAQYFGLAQRRRRVFVLALGGAGGWACADALLSITNSLSGHPAPRRQTGKVAPTIPSRSTAGGGLGTDFDLDGGTICVATGQAGAEIGADMAPTLNCNHEAPYVAHSLRGEGFDASEDGNGRGTPLGPVAFAENSRHELRLEGGDGQRTGALSTGGGKPGQGVPMIAFPANLSGTQCASAEDVAPSMGAANPTAVAYGIRTANTSSNGGGIQEEHTHTLDCAQGVAVAQPVVHAIQAGALRVNPASGPDGVGVQADHAYTLEARAEVQAVQSAMQVRRLTPEECEALQGFPRGYTNVPHRKKPAADGPQSEQRGPDHAKGGVRWFPNRMPKRKVPRAQLGQGPADAGGGIAQHKGPGQTGDSLFVHERYCHGDRWPPYRWPSIRFWPCPASAPCL